MPIVLSADTQRNHAEKAKRRELFSQSSVDLDSRAADAQPQSLQWQFTATIKDHHAPFVYISPLLTQRLNGRSSLSNW